MRIWLLALCAPLAVCSTALGGEGEPPLKQMLAWEELPPMPDALGFGGPFVGVSNGALIVAGGANFPTPLFEGGKKMWLASLFVLEKGASKWLTCADHAFKLPCPLAYGVSFPARDAALPTGSGLYVAGGCDAGRCYDGFFSLDWVRGPRATKVVTSPGPDLPMCCAMGGGARLGSTLYLAGGQYVPTAVRAMRNFWAFDLSERAPRWRELAPWPGPARILPVVAAQCNGEEEEVYVISGAELFPGPDGKPARRYLRDGYAYSPKGKTWRRIADAPRPVVAAPAAPWGKAHILVFGGDDGANATRIQELKDAHPGFSRDILAYRTTEDKWAKVGEMPAGQVTTTAVWWQGGIALPSGEVRPGTRTPKVLFATPAVARLSWLDYAICAVYLAASVLVGLLFVKEQRTIKDYFLAGRSMGAVVVAISVLAALFSGITYLGAPGEVYKNDLSFMLVLLAYFIATPVTTIVFLPFFYRARFYTAYQYLEERFSVGVRTLSSVLFVIRVLLWLALATYAPALALQQVTGLPLSVTILVTGVLTTLYTTLGGMKAVIWTDVMQFVVLFGGQLVILAVALTRIPGGVAGAYELGRQGGKLVLSLSLDPRVRVTLWGLVLGGAFMNLVQMATDQVSVQRYMTATNLRVAQRSLWLKLALTLPVVCIFYVTGVVLFAFYRGDDPLAAERIAKADQILPYFVVTELPLGMPGLLIAAIYAASMSTISAGINSLTTASLVDFYKRLWRPNATPEHQLRLAKWLTLAYGALVLILAFIVERMGGLLEASNTAIGLVGGPLLGLFLLGMLTRRANAQGAVIGWAAGLAVLIPICFLTKTSFLWYAAIGCIVTCGVGLAASLASSPPAAKQLDGLTFASRYVKEESEQ